MGYHDVLFPLVVGYGSAGGLSHKTAIFVMDSGQEQRVGRWSTFRKVFDANTGVRSPADIATLRHFIAARRGALHSFPVKDYADFTTASDDVGTPSTSDVNIGTGDASETDFQLYKRYGDATNGVNWNIKKPVTGTVVVAVNGSPIDPDDFTLDASTGIITLDSAPADGHAVTIGCEFYVPCRFGEEVDDEYMTSMEDVGVSSADEILMIEDMSPSAIADEFDYGGAASLTLAASSITDLSAYISRRMLTILAVPNTSTKLKLPNTVAIPCGGPYFVIHVKSGVAATLTVVNTAGTTVGTIAADSSKSAWLMNDNGTKTWLLV